MYPDFASKMTPEPALWKGRSRGPESCGTSKKRRKNGSSNKGFCGPFSWMVPRVAMFTMAGETFLIIGESEGTGVSPIAEGIAAGAPGATEASTSQAAKANGMDFMPRSYLRGHSESVPPPEGISLAISPQSKCDGAARP